MMLRRRKKPHQTYGSTPPPSLMRSKREGERRQLFAQETPSTAFAAHPPAREAPPRHVHRSRLWLWPSAYYSPRLVSQANNVLFKERRFCDSRRKLPRAVGLFLRRHADCVNITNNK